MRRLVGLAAAVMAVLVAGGAPAQEGGAASVPKSVILTVDRDRLLLETRFGQAVEAQFKRESEALIAENLRLEQALEAEERSLTDQRATLPAEEFRSLAEAFDAKTEAIRDAQDDKSRAITARRDADRQRFLQAAVPVLADLMREAEAVAIFDKDMAILSLRGVDITDAAIARIDLVLGDGATVGPSPGTEEPGAVQGQP